MNLEWFNKKLTNFNELILIAKINDVSPFSVDSFISQPASTNFYNIISSSIWNSYIKYKNGVKISSFFNNLNLAFKFVLLLVHNNISVGFTTSL